MNEAVPKVSKTRFDSDTIALDKTFHGAPSGQSSEAQTTKQRTHEPLNKELNITGAPELRLTFLLLCWARLSRANRGQIEDPSEAIEDQSRPNRDQSRTNRGQIS